MAGLAFAHGATLPSICKIGDTLVSRPTHRGRLRNGRSGQTPMTSNTKLAAWTMALSMGAFTLAALTLAAPFSGAPFLHAPPVAGQRLGDKRLPALASSKDLSRRPGGEEAGESSEPGSSGFWEDAEVPADGRGYDPAATWSSDSREAIESKETTESMDTAGAAKAGSESGGDVEASPVNRDTPRSCPRKSCPRN
jgi:hypothetical protein